MGQGQQLSFQDTHNSGNMESLFVSNQVLRSETLKFESTQ